MEPRLRVTQVATPMMTPDGVPQGWSREPWPDAEQTDRDTEIAPVRALRATIASADHGPCLYLGPSGQRCNKRSSDGGFCAAHAPGAPRAAAANPGRFLAATAAILGILWPYLEFAVREFIRWAHTH